MAEPRPGRLVLCATPIGNLGDLSTRMIDCLSSSDVIAAEDTRRTRKILSHAGISARLTSYHRGNQARQDERLVDTILGGRTVALVTDAGMPTVSDPGASLVRRCVDAGIDVDCVPGPSAPLTALALSGLETERFVFEGFLPRSGADRRRRLGAVADEHRTVILLEAPHRLAATLADLARDVGPERRVAVCRELTKLHQEVERTTLGEAAETWAIREPRGEYVLVIEGAADAPVDEAAQVELIREALLAGASTRDAAAAATGLPKRRAYAMALELAGSRGGAGEDSDGAPG